VPRADDLSRDDIIPGTERGRRTAQVVWARGGHLDRRRRRARAPLLRSRHDRRRPALVESARPHPEAAEDVYERYYPREGLKQSAYATLRAIFEAGLPPKPSPPTKPTLHIGPRQS
jgi:hypothetical protein